MTKVARKGISEMKAIATEEEIHELEKLFALGLKLELAVQRLADTRGKSRAVPGARG